MIVGTHLTVKFSRVVDGDTIRIFLPGEEKDESVRILCLDTEESRAAGGKPKTPWGLKAKERAEAFFADAENIVIEFPGNEDFETSVKKYRGNFGRLLVFVYRDDIDFQETMIREGYSPYFMKYGNAEFTGHHLRYQKAEREAQSKKIGVWDQVTVNGQEMRNYAALGIWWKLRGNLIDNYRRLKAIDGSVQNTRLDYGLLAQKAVLGEKATIFTEVRGIQRVGGKSGLVRIGSVEQPFNLFVPDLDSDEGQEVSTLLATRYFSDGDDRPGLSYAYVTGELSTFRDNPQMVLNSADQISDSVPHNRMDIRSAQVVIAALLPNPSGRDAGNETITLKNIGDAEADLQGWKMQDKSGSSLSLDGKKILAAEELKIALQARQLPLNNTGDEITLLDKDGKIISQVTYSRSEAVSGKEIRFVD